MITIRKPDEIYVGHGEIENGTFEGRWHFSFGPYHDDQHTHFGNLRVFNDDTLSPGAVWPLHSHRNIEVVTYCAGGEFRHADERGEGGLLEKGGVQHTTVGRGMKHSEINNRPDQPMRFIQMWFYPRRPDLEPSVEQRQISRNQRTNRWAPLVSNADPYGLPIASDARVYACFLQKGQTAHHQFEPGHGGYLYVLEGGPVRCGENDVPALAAVEAVGEGWFTVAAQDDAELLLVDTALEVPADAEGMID